MELVGRKWEVTECSNAPGIQIGSLVRFDPSGEEAFKMLAGLTPETINDPQILITQSPWTADCTVKSDPQLGTVHLGGTCPTSGQFVLCYKASDPAELKCTIAPPFEPVPVCAHSSPVAGLLALWIGGSSLGSQGPAVLVFVGLLLLLLLGLGLGSILRLFPWMGNGGTSSSSTWMAVDMGPISPPSGTGT